MPFAPVTQANNLKRTRFERHFISCLHRPQANNLNKVLVIIQIKNAQKMPKKSAITGFEPVSTE